MRVGITEIDILNERNNHIFNVDDDLLDKGLEENFKVVYVALEVVLDDI